MPLGLDMVIHCQAMRPFADTWRSIHTRETHAAPDVRFYTNAVNRAYTPTREAAAEAITRQALEPIDFPATVLQAWEDGVRVFVEHGPRAILTGAIPKILGDRPHLAVALDPQERRGLRALAETVSKLWVNGLPVHIDAFDARIEQLRGQSAVSPERNARKLTLAAHWPDIAPVPVASAAPDSVSVPMPESGHERMPELDPAQFQHMPHAPAHLVPLVFAKAALAQSQTSPNSHARSPRSPPRRSPASPRSATRPPPRSTWSRR